MKLPALVESHGMEYGKTCRHRHQLNGTGAIFFQSLGFLKCAKCNGFQAIKKPLK